MTAKLYLEMWKSVNKGITLNSYQNQTVYMMLNNSEQNTIIYKLQSQLKQFYFYIYLILWFDSLVSFHDSKYVNKK